MAADWSRCVQKKKERERRKKDGEEPILMKLKCRGEEENDVNKSLFFHVWNCQLRVSTVHVWMLVNKVSCVCRVVMATTRGKTSAMSLWWWIPWSLRCHVKCGHICPKCVKVKRTNIFIRNARRRSVQRERFFCFFLFSVVFAPDGEAAESLNALRGYKLCWSD